MTASTFTGGCHEVVQSLSFAPRDDPRPAPRRGQTLSVAVCFAVFHSGDCDGSQFVPRHLYVHQDAPETVEQSFQDWLEETTRPHGAPLYSAGADSSGWREDMSRARSRPELQRNGPWYAYIGV